VSKEPVGIIGAGWVGIVTAACLAELGHDVVVRDVIPEKVEALRAGEMTIHEEGLTDFLNCNRERLTFTTELEDVIQHARVVFICVGTPSTYSGDADLSAVWHLIDELAEAGVQGGSVVVMKSTVPVGTGQDIRSALDAAGLAHVGYVSNPEFLAEGTAVRDFMSPDRVVIGAFQPDHRQRLAAIYEDLGTEIVATDIASAEMIKLASNAFLATRISFINEIANVCEATGADVVEVAHGMGLDQRLGPHFLRAGIGYGGSCFPKDVSALKQLAGNSGYHFQLLNAVIEVNELQKRRVVGKLEKHLGDLRDRVITLLGLAFKPGTNDMREASSLVLASRLISVGAVVRGWDPVALKEAGDLLAGVELFDDPLKAIQGADAAVVVTEWSVLRELSLSDVAAGLRTPILIDGRNLLDPEAARAAGLTYEGIGRGQER
jgi:UDPglucose 6-dehydrogenase